MPWKFLVLMMSLSGCVYTELPQEPPAENNLAGSPLPDGTLDDGLTGEFLLGQFLFEREWSPEEVGPVFNASSCAECHASAGRAPAASVGLLFRLSAAPDSDEPEPMYGSQLQPRGLRNAPGEGRVIVTHEDVGGAYDDGILYVLRRPRYQIVELGYGPISETMVMSPRLAQQIPGLGLLEAIYAAEILALVDPQDLDGDGISGRANVVFDVVTGRETLGRFGWKAGQPSLRQQNAAAFMGDLGMTSALFGEGPCTADQASCWDAMFDPASELSESDLNAVTLFTQLLMPTATADLAEHPGYTIFQEVGCASCHVEEWTTGAHEITELSEQVIRPFTDLLLHDMGEDLADHRPEGIATGMEWRTPPLWGIGSLIELNGHQDLMHDGRAKNVEEAILWHGGEGAAAAAAFKTLSANDRARLIAFVNLL
jgi:CxxC motif-containing protein (DUF1111 family)